MTDFAMITGGVRNIGAAIAEHLSGDGFRIIVIDRLQPDHGAVDEFIRVDLSDVRATSRALAGICDGRRIRCLVNNAGIVMPATLEETAIDDLERVLAVNLTAAVISAQAVLPSMKTTGPGLSSTPSRSASWASRKTWPTRWDISSPLAPAS